MTTRPRLGITVGKFYPFHLGHDALIRQAKAQVEHLVVLLGYKPGQEVPVAVRAAWIRYLHPDVEVIEAREDIPEAPEPWAERALALLGGRRPNLAFTSEAYGEPWAAHMGASHVVVDAERNVYPISGTALRADLGHHWAMLTPPAKAYFAKRVCVLGVESSGTTTLAQALAAHYQTVWVPEYGRWYWEGRRYVSVQGPGAGPGPGAGSGEGSWDTYEFIEIARGQAAWEDALAMRANRLVICDTDALATHVWHRRYVGHFAPEVERIADRRRYDLYILTEPDFGFVQDGSRDGEHIRMDMHAWFVDVLRAKQKHFITVSGAHTARLARAISAIEPLITFPALAPP